MLGRKVTEEQKRKIGKKNKIHMKKAWAEDRISEKAKQNLFKKGDNRIGKETQFKKGITPWIKGKTHSEEVRKKMSEELFRQYKEGRRIPPMIGKTHNKKTRDKISKKNKGRKVSLETRKKLSENKKGNKSHLWKGGITPISSLRRHGLKWRLWRKSVFERDYFICQNKNCKYCKNKKGVNLHPHHKISVSKRPDLIYEISNGISYCKDYHIKFGNLHKNIKKK